MRIFLAIQIRLYRDGLTEAFGRESDYEVVGAAPTFDATLRATAELAPDVVLVEHAMPRASVLVRELAAARAKVVVLGVEDVPEDIVPLVEAGICAYVPREGSLRDLLGALAATARGETFCSPRVTAGLMARLAQLNRERRTVDGAGSLTSRERQIVSLIDQGLSNRDIARRLDIELPTVKGHVHNILEKLHVHRRGEAAARLRTRTESG